MKFSANGLYVERYIKCNNCGVLIYDGDAGSRTDAAGHAYCSDWCVDWEKTREARRSAVAAGNDWTQHAPRKS
mgnify:CR=1 FL=1